jgi:hypothetical protein
LAELSKLTLIDSVAGGKSAGKNQLSITFLSKDYDLSRLISAVSSKKEEMPTGHLFFLRLMIYVKIC